MKKSLLLIALLSALNVQAEDKNNATHIQLIHRDTVGDDAVSYTHLTLPTKA